MPVVSRGELRQFIPHAGAMCLLDSVERWDTSGITCLTSSHRNPLNPLRTGSRLEAISGLEYAAQAMAVHVGLLASKSRVQPGAGYLGSVRDLKVKIARLDDIVPDLVIEAARLIGDESCFIYSFLIRQESEILLSGRGSIFVKQWKEQMQ